MIASFIGRRYSFTPHQMTAAEFQNKWPRFTNCGLVECSQHFEDFDQIVSQTTPSNPNPINDNYLAPRTARTTGGEHPHKAAIADYLCSGYPALFETQAARQQSPITFHAPSLLAPTGGYPV